ncbi:hypothetical protein [Papillibacter cinnamivorans]|uniref:Uncharacterized protein n=1 Tax=Papillibacter cinnamivorans DSM 12816 TaxID=1122930 RepID=A0A1W1Z139_9FIRM|nr:hypothetical protein [Papillibacter cinnamivorans]SMC42032.1 hypothetical protein SAMN02745168_0845 [Papillibacter cinnamivorans DSM 12816]
MDIVMDAAVAFLAALGLLAAMWALAGKWILPAGRTGGVTALVRAEGNAAELEHTVDGLRWLNRSGFAEMRILIADAGMDREARKAAEALAEEDCTVQVCGLDEIGTILRNG